MGPKKSLKGAEFVFEKMGLNPFENKERIMLKKTIKKLADRSRAILKFVFASVILLYF